MKLLSQHIESLIFTSEKPIKLKEIKSILEETFETKFKNNDLETAIEEIEKRYEGDEHAFEMVGIADGYQFLTKGSYFNTVATFLKQTTRKRLSRAALETLSIIAYKQPVSRPELEKIRGVSCDYAIHKLLEKEMVTILGRSEAVGRPLLYGTSEKFMDYFGLKTLNDMPKPKDFNTPENSIGEAAPIEEDTPNPNSKPRLELPISDLDEVVDMIAAILPPGPKVEIPEIEEEEETSNPDSNIQLELPITDLEEVVDMIAAVLPPEPKVEIPDSEKEELQPTAASEKSNPDSKAELIGGAASELSQTSNVDEASNGNPPEGKLTNVGNIIPPIPSQEPKIEKENSTKAPTIAQLFAEATKPKPSNEAAEVVKIIPPVSQEPKSEDENSAKPPTIAQLFAEATKPKASEPSKELEMNTGENKISNELDEAVDVITASVPIENIPSESIVLQELIKKSGASSEEE